MIAALRKRHFRMWLVIAAVVPVLAIIGYVMAPKFPVDNYGMQNTSYPELLRSVVSENYVFNIKKGYGGTQILEIMQISKINPVTELVTAQYSKGSSKKKNNVVIGMMGGDKIYRFNLKDIQSPFSVTVTDTVKHQTLSQIDF